MMEFLGIVFDIIIVIGAALFSGTIFWVALTSIGRVDPDILEAYEGKHGTGEVETIETVYKGGFSDVSIKNETCDVLFFKDKIKFLFRNNQAFRDVKEVLNQDIVSVEYATEAYIQNQISLGGLMVFGWAGALALGGSTRDIKEFVMIRYIDNEDNSQRAIILNALDRDELLKRLKKQKAS